jgi:hypothetical protein
MVKALRLPKSFVVLFHCLGFSCLSGAVLHEILTFIEILQYGRSVCVEPNPAILTSEIVLSFFTLIYFMHLFQRFIHKLIHG